MIQKPKNGHQQLTHTHKSKWAKHPCSIKGLSRKSPAVVNTGRTVAWWQCNPAAKESRLDCACVNDEDFTILTSEGGARHRVRSCAMRPSQSTWLSKESSESVSDFARSLNILHGNSSDDAEGRSCGPGAYRQLHHHTPARASRLVQTVLVNIKSPTWLSPPTAQIGHPATSGCSQN